MRPALVFGAGAAGSRVINAMLNEESDLYPVGLLDDDVRLAKLRVRSVSVHGTRADLARVAQATGAEVLVLAMPSVTADDWAAIGREGRDCGLEVLNLPPVTQLFGTVTVKDFKPVSTHDLLGRDQVRTGPDGHLQLSQRQAGAGHRRRRVDRLGAVPPDPPVQPGHAGDARHRRHGASRTSTRHGGPRPAR
nr:hypothetical protein [Candidatus Microthrix sp.]